MSKYEVIVKEAWLTTYFVEAEDADEAEQIIADGDCTVDYQENLDYEVVKIIKVKGDL
jgi:uncharacterized protein (AIM24 family)|tara:strand:+ start:339 stop:512 length:174 start_codon:yes stop_codon:yes gene_type:complete